MNKSFLPSDDSADQRSLINQNRALRDTYAMPKVSLGLKLAMTDMTAQEAAPADVVGTSASKDTSGPSATPTVPTA